MYDFGYGFEGTFCRVEAPPVVILAPAPELAPRSSAKAGLIAVNQQTPAMAQEETTVLAASWAICWILLKLCWLLEVLKPETLAKARASRAIVCFMVVVGSFRSGTAKRF